MNFLIAENFVFSKLKFILTKGRGGWTMEITPFLATSDIAIFLLLSYRSDRRDRIVELKS